jgi:hypothetical protein
MRLRAGKVSAVGFHAERIFGNEDTLSRFDNATRKATISWWIDDV